MNLLVLTYHYFHRDAPWGIKAEDYPFSVPLTVLEKHCADLAGSGYHIIDPAMLTQPEEQLGGDHRQVLITIDDGHHSIEDALPIMLKYRFRPVLHVTAGLIGREYYLEWPELRRMVLHGISIQSHAMNHHDLTKLPAPELARELTDSKKTIEDNIGQRVTTLAAPMGRIDRRVMQAALDAGYEVIMTSYTGINRGVEDLHMMKRFQVKSGRRRLMVDEYFSAISAVRAAGAAKNLVKKVRGRLW
jgi:peptidoglycan/xylan/chitin deacetylase (PgdA/CDA1 family)